jgi:secondary thiamine-phosphate synthase enzyme
MVKRLSVNTSTREQFVNITTQVKHAALESGITSGVLTLFVPHTTAAVTINENADPDVVADMLRGLSDLVPRTAPFYRHSEGNSDAHIKASLMGNSVQVLLEEGQLQLGTWQAVYFCEFDGPRSRKLWVKVSPDEE